jgi:hypothetical protein
MMIFSWAVALLAVTSCHIGDAIRPTQVATLEKFSSSKEAVHREFALHHFTLEQLKVSA